MSKPRILVITGRPGVGKTTVVVEAAKILSGMGFAVDGFYSREIRARGARRGFELVDFKTGNSVVLADTSIEGPRIGKYRVNLKGIEEFVPRVVDRAIKSSDIIVCDEVGPMELLSPAFKRSMSKLLSLQDKKLVVVVHRSMRDPVMKAFVRHPESMVLEVTEENRDDMPKRIVDTIVGRDSSL